MAVAAASDPARGPNPATAGSTAVATSGAAAVNMLLSAMAAYARAYYAYVTPIVLQIAAAWAFVDAGSEIDAELRFIAGAGFAARRITRSAIGDRRAARIFADGELSSFRQKTPVALATERERS